MKVIFGAGGFAKEVHLIYRRSHARTLSSDNLISCFVCSDSDAKNQIQVNNVPVISESEFFSRYKNIDLEIYIAISNPNIKYEVVSKIKDWNKFVAFPCLIDPSAIVDYDYNLSKISEGVIVGINSVVETDVSLGRFCQINMGCTIGHDSILSDYVTISPGSNISGSVNLGDGVFCGSGSVVLDGIYVSPGVVLGAGCVVVKNIRQKGVYVGIPAALIKKL